MHRTEAFDKTHLVEIVKSYSNTLGEVNEIVSGKWSPIKDSAAGTGKSPSATLSQKKLEIMNYLVESAVPKGTYECPLQMTRIRDKDYIIDLVLPPESQTHNLSLTQEETCSKLTL